MFIIKSGECEYALWRGEVLEPPPQPRESIAEAVLWTHWIHQGSLKACTASTLLGLDPNKFCKVMFLDPRPWFLAVDYGQRFVKFVNQLDSHLFLDILRDATFFDLSNFDTRPMIYTW